MILCLFLTFKNEYLQYNATWTAAILIPAIICLQEDSYSERNWESQEKNRLSWEVFSLKRQFMYYPIILLPVIPTHSMYSMNTSIHIRIPLYFILVSPHHIWSGITLFSLQVSVWFESHYIAALQGLLAAKFKVDCTSNQHPQRTISVQLPSFSLVFSMVVLKRHG